MRISLLAATSVLTFLINCPDLGAQSFEDNAESMLATLVAGYEQAHDTLRNVHAVVTKRERYADTFASQIQRDVMQKRGGDGELVFSPSDSRVSLWQEGDRLRMDEIALGPEGREDRAYQTRISDGDRGAIVFESADPRGQPVAYIVPSEQVSFNESGILYDPIRNPYQPFLGFSPRGLRAAGAEVSLAEPQPVDLEGVKTYAIEWRKDKETARVYIDPDRNFLPLRMERRDTNGRLTFLAEAQGVVESKGVLVPQVWRETFYNMQGEIKFERLVTLETLEIDPRFAPNLFKLEFPPEMLVINQITGEVVQSPPPPPEAQATDLAREFLGSETAGESEDETANSPLNSDGSRNGGAAVPAAVENTEESTYRGPWLLLSTLGLLVIAFGLLRTVRRKSRVDHA